MDKPTLKQRSIDTGQVEGSSKNNFVPKLSCVGRFKKCCTTSSGLKVALFLWGIFSVMYISVDQFARFRSTLVTQAYQSARNDLLVDFIAQTTKKSCETVTVASPDGSQRVTVINVACLMPQDTGSSTQEIAQ